MTRDLLPLVMAVVREEGLEEQLFLTTFLADEAKHTEFFRRVLDEVCRQSGDLQRYQTLSFRRLFAEQLPVAMRRLLVDPSPTAQAEALVGRALAGAPGAEQVVRDILGWVGDQLQPVPIEVRREGTGPVYTFHVGSGNAPGGALLITQEGAAQHTTSRGHPATRRPRLPERPGPPARPQ